MDFNIFSLPSMEDAHIYELSTSPYQAQFYAKSSQFTSGSKKIGIIDQFQGKRPIVLNREYVVEKKPLEVRIVQTLVLDSHVVDALHRYVSGKGKIDEDTRIVTRDFLVHVSELNCDYSPLFYLAENWAKSSKEQFVKTSSEKLSSILKLHCMDERAFIDRNEIIYKPDSVEHYCELYGAQDLDSCGLNWALSYAENAWFEEWGNLTKLSYACLLKMVLIHFMKPGFSPENILDKYHEFETFLLNELDLMLGRELNLALYYFSNFAGKFISVQPNMKTEKAKKNLKSTAWDLLLLRLPEFLLAPTHLPELNTAYVVTSEDKLLSVGDMFSLETIFYENKTSQGSPILSFDTELFQTVLSKADLITAQNQRSKWIQSRASKGKPDHITPQKLDWLIEDLEIQLGYLCVS
ncbi:hypothetical protein ACYVL9_002692 [Vibrio fluvialis]